LQCAGFYNIFTAVYFLYFYIFYIFIFIFWLFFVTPQRLWLWLLLTRASVPQTDAASAVGSTVVPLVVGAGAAPLPPPPDSKIAVLTTVGDDARESSSQPRAVPDNHAQGSRRDATRRTQTSDDSTGEAGDDPITLAEQKLERSAPLLKALGEVIVKQQQEQEASQPSKTSITAVPASDKEPQELDSYDVTVLLAATGKDPLALLNCLRSFRSGFPHPTRGRVLSPFSLVRAPVCIVSGTAYLARRAEWIWANRSYTCFVP
jgi:hypothetical protein